jgi:glutaredoxin-related protein
MVGIHFITFADGMCEKYVKASSNLRKMAIEYDIFDSIQVYGLNDIKEDLEFKQHLPFLQNRRGFGYWIWKPYIIWKKLCSMPENDILVYLDSCCTLNLRGKPRFMEYIDIVKLNDSGNMFIELESTIESWCKMDTIFRLNAQSVQDKKEIVPGVIFTTNNEKNRNLFKSVFDIISSDYHLVDDTPSIIPNASTYNEHRHDQSIFSIVVRQQYSGSIYYNIFNEFYFEGLNPKFKREDYPIWIHSNNY